MSKALSLDLRVRVPRAVAECASHRAAAARLGVSAASVSRWRALDRMLGDPRPGTWAGGDCTGRGEHLTIIAVAQGRDAAESTDRAMSA